MPFIPDNNNQTKQSGFIPDEKSWGGFAQNVVSSGANFIGDTVKGVANIFNPEFEKNTFGQLLLLSSSIIEALIPGEQGAINTDRAKAFADYLIDRYGSWENIKNTAYSDPIGIIDDAALVLQGGGRVVTKLDDVSKIGKIMTKLGDMGDIGGQMGKLAGKGVGAVGDATKGIQKPIGQMTEDFGRRFVTGGMGQPSKQVAETSDVMLKYQDLMKRDASIGRGVYNDLGKKYGDIMTDLGKQGKTIMIEDLLSEIDADINKLAASGNKTGTRQLLELTDYRDMITNRFGESGAISPELLWNFRKETIDPDVAPSDFGLSGREKSQSGAAKKTRDVFKYELDQLDPRLAELGRERQIINPLVKRGGVFEKSALRALNRQPINFTKLGGATLGGVTGGIPGAVGGFLLENTLNNPKISGNIARGLTTLGKNIKSAKIPKLQLPEKVTGVISKTAKASKPLRAFQRVSDSQSVQTLKQNQEAEKQRKQLSSDNSISKAIKDKNKKNPFYKL